MYNSLFLWHQRRRPDADSKMIKDNPKVKVGEISIIYITILSKHQSIDRNVCLKQTWKIFFKKWAAWRDVAYCQAGCIIKVQVYFFLQVQVYFFLQPFSLQKTIRTRVCLRNREKVFFSFQ